MKDKKNGSLIIKNGYILPMSKSIPKGFRDLYIENGKIKKITENQEDTNSPQNGNKEIEIIDAKGCAVLPGFNQAHIHLCQTLFRGLGEDLDLIPWLKEKILPLEASHNEKSIEISAKLALTELLLSGVTGIQTMETSFGTEIAISVIEKTNISALTGPCLLDKWESVPKSMILDSHESLKQVISLSKKYKNNIRVALCPRFSLSCSEKLLKEIREISLSEDLRIHTHASENRLEIQKVKEETGTTDIEYLYKLGILSEKTTLTHCVHAKDDDLRRIKESKTSIATCPSANLKLASGIPPVYKFLSMGINTGLGSDGAPCNNRLDPFFEMNLVGKLQKILAGPKAISAESILEMATIGSAKAMGMESEIGSLEPGKRANIVIINLKDAPLAPGGSIYTKIVYSASPENIKFVIVGGKIVVKERELLLWDKEEVVNKAEEELKKLLLRANI